MLFAGLCFNKPRLFIYRRLDIAAEKTRGLIISRDVFLSHEEEEVYRTFPQLDLVFQQNLDLRFVAESKYKDTFLSVPRTRCLLSHKTFSLDKYFR